MIRTIHKTVHKTTAALISLLGSTQALAHGGEHGYSMMEWLSHLFGSSHHLLGLVGIMAVIGLVTVILRLAKSSGRKKLSLTEQ